MDSNTVYLEEENPNIKPTPEPLPISINPSNLCILLLSFSISSYKSGWLVTPIEVSINILFKIARIRSLFLAISNSHTLFKS